MKMITDFPNFKNIELSDQTEINDFITKSNIPPYADYNFVNIWTWNINGKMKVCLLNENLVILFDDYQTNKEFLSFIGNNKISETASILIDYSISTYNTNELKLIPEEIINLLDKNKFKVIEDRDSFDYIYSVDSLADMNSWCKSDNHSKNLFKFIELYNNYVTKCTDINESNKDEYLNIFKKWSLNKKINDYSTLNEYKAFERLFTLSDNSNTKIISLYINNILQGFTVFEILSNDFAVAHFSKANTKLHSGIYDVLIWEEAKILMNYKIKYYNFEQDLGISGIRYSKESFNPIYLLKKYFVRK